jgi:transcriptional regulator with XRE-family HTH domain
MRLGAIFRAVRVRHRSRQSDVALRAGVSRTSVGRVERGLGATLTLRTLETIAAVLEIKLDIDARWRGGDLRRLLNAGHSAMHERMARRLQPLSNWLVKAEVSFSIYGERGVIDILAFHPGTGAVLVIELKTALVDVQELLGTVDRYQRLAARIALERGWRPKSVSCWVVLRDTMTNRRRVAAHATVLRAAFPSGGREIAAWLREPRSTIQALSFTSDARLRTHSDSIPGTKRVRRPQTTSGRAQGSDQTQPGRESRPA